MKSVDKSVPKSYINATKILFISRPDLGSFFYVKSTQYMKNDKIKLSVTILVIIILPLLIWSWYIPFISVHDRPAIDEAIVMQIERGWSLMKIANELEKHSLIGNAGRFVWTARIMGIAGSLKAGRYCFDERQSNFAILQKLNNGNILLQSVTIPEGMRATAIASLLSKSLNLDSAIVMNYVSNPEFCRSLNIEAAHLEGYLYPDTYAFEDGVTEKEIILRMVNQFHIELNNDLLQRVKKLNFTLHQIITLASIIEGEVIVDMERSKVSSVYHNRLQRRIPLQADPTIQYIVPDGPRRLYQKHLKIQSPYNTYMHYGLPPGPIGNPGIASIKAALYPDDTDFLYFVAIGNGAHTFSKTLADHNSAKAHFNQIRRDVRRSARK